MEGSDLAKEGVAYPHTAHCLPDNTVMISTMGDPKGNSLGEFVLIDAETWKVKGKILNTLLSLNTCGSSQEQKLTV